MQFPNLEPILSPILWAVVGAVATRLYMPERMTNDLDILVRAQDADEAVKKLAQEGATNQGKLGIGRSSWLLPRGFSLDVIAWREEWVEKAIQEAQTNRDAQYLPILPLPYLVLMKFRASRVQDLADISRMLGQGSEEQCAAVRIVFEQWQADGLADIESLLQLGRLEASSGGSDSSTRRRDE